ncbi:unnamed protein product [Parascedosporium putredinis]|uniref:Uncharacterized protein n=1 Tax=Parascedosporium putredinis TaxID=1442378 RepID=A0A9P1HAV5_9PEZI|nr:unnamed protein product [Parascedosporium putredinis]CAI8001728.1 unnamed protein product [Parascedosporium putredinis]
MDELIGQAPPEDGNIDDRVNYVVILLDLVKKLVGNDLSAKWRQKYDLDDLEEEVWRLKQQLRLSIPLGDRVNLPAKPQTALERSNDERIRELTEIVKRLENQRDELGMRNWELEYRTRLLDKPGLGGGNVRGRFYE